MIRSLRLTNYKCFEEQDFALGRLTLLAGINGLGKSSVLQSLLLLRQSHEQGLLQTVGLALNGNLVRIGAASDALYEGAKAEEIGFGIALDDGTTAHWRFSYDRQADVLALVSQPASHSVMTSTLFGDQFQYLQAERLGPRTSFEMSDFLVRRHKQLGARGEYTAHFLLLFSDTLVANVRLHHPKATSTSLRDQVEAWMGEISPGTRLEVSANTGVDLVTLQYSFVRGSQITNRYRSTNVGFGLTYILPVLVAALSAQPGGLLLIENPEAHLHPQGQARIGELLARASAGDVQVLVETHSDHVLNGIRLAVHDGLISHQDVGMHFFQRSRDTSKGPVDVFSPRIDPEGRIDNWPEGFFDQWDKSLEALLSPRP